MAGEIMKMLGIEAGAPVAAEKLEKMTSAWIEIYLSFMLLKSHNPETQKKLDALQLKLAEANELITAFEL